MLRAVPAPGAPMVRFASFREFCPFYLGQHRNRTCRRLHVPGSGAERVLAALGCGYGFAWVGHFLFEHNRPATFSHPPYSFAGAWMMFVQVLRGRLPSQPPRAGYTRCIPGDRVPQGAY